MSDEKKDLIPIGPEARQVGKTFAAISQPVPSTASVLTLADLRRTYQALRDFCPPPPPVFEFVIWDELDPIKDLEYDGVTINTTCEDITNRADVEMGRPEIEGQTARTVKLLPAAETKEEKSEEKS